MFDKTGFDEHSIIAAKIENQHAEDASRFLKKNERDKIVQEMRRIAKAKTAGVEPRFVVSMFTGSSFDFQKLQIFVDETGEGYFKRGNRREIMFYSATLPGLLAEMK